MRVLLLILSVVAIALPASAGSRDAPEVPDAAGDCAYAAGNEYADIVAAWISDETAMDFVVNIGLSKWTQDMLASYAGYTLQFTHQGVQWGVAALYNPQGGWEWSTGHIDTETGAMGNFTETTGEWDATSATMSIVFPKAIFPHAGDDNRLHTFAGGTADFKKDLPIFLAQGVGAPVPSQDYMLCDLVESASEYAFTVGQHTMPAAGTPSTPDPAASDEGTSTTPPAPAPTPTPPSQATPGAGLLHLVGVLACLAAWRRRF